MPVQTVIKFRRDTAANWVSANPTLAAGEVGLETDSGLVKYGNGTSGWNALPYNSTAAIRTRVLNQTGSPVVKGSVVYINGANGDNPTIALADADTEATSSKTLGFVDETIANGAIGYVVEAGLITGLNTSTATAGQSVWLSSTAGGFVYGAPPAKPAHSVYLGVVIRAQSQNGAILVKVQNGYELNEIHDVNAPSPSTGQVLQWNGSAWVNATLDALPSQAGNSGEYLTTDGSSASWAPLNLANKTIADPTITVTLPPSYQPGAPLLTFQGSTALEGISTPGGVPVLTVYVDLSTYADIGDIVFLNCPTDTTLPTIPLEVYQFGGYYVWLKVLSGPTAAGTYSGVDINGINSSVLITGATVSATEISYLDGVTSNIQTQLNSKAATLEQLGDVLLTSPLDNGQTLVYNTGANKWVNGAAAATGETISSFLLMGA